MNMNRSALRYEYKLSPFGSHSKLLHLAAVEFAQSKVCLDVGCAAGFLAKGLKQLGWKVIGIEPDPEAAEQAVRICDSVLNQRIEDVNFSELKPFNAVVLGDVLEHLAEPKRVLDSIYSSLEEEGSILVSIPNVANITVRLGLLFGKFNYTNRGILDHTHLRFYTKKSLLAMIRESKYEIQRIQVTPIPIELYLSFLLKKKYKLILYVLDSLTRIFPTVLGYQFIIQAKKQSNH
jgi:2-polyprenyl-3-methyl-5-hydroxy-6-metoxy-1,4-benzoquinol methylase